MRAQWVRDLALYGPSRVEEERLVARVLSVQMGIGGCVAATCDGLVEPVLWNALCGSRTGGGSVAGRVLPARLCFDCAFC